MGWYQRRVHGALEANLSSSSSSSMIKALVVLSVVALAMGAPEADAKADPYYGYYGLGHYGYAGYPYAYGGYYYGKRSAEAEAAPAASADPYYGYYGLGHYGYAGYPYVAVLLSTARGPLRPPPLPSPLLIPTTATMALATTAMPATPMPTMATTTESKKDSKCQRMKTIRMIFSWKTFYV